MAATIRIKRSSTVGDPATLAQGEFAYSYLAQALGFGQPKTGGDKLYVGTGTETAGDAATHQVVGGKFYVDLLHGDSVPSYGTILPNRAVILDSSSAVDNWTVDNVNINGNIIRSTSGTLNLTSADSTVSLAHTAGGNNRITNVAEPVSATDAATKNYVDNASPSTAIKINNDTISLDSDIYFAAGAGLSVTHDSNTAGATITYAGIDATTAVKGIASFNAADFAVTSGDVTIKAKGVGNAQLEFDSVTIGTTSVALGAATTTLAGLTQVDVGNLRLTGNTLSTTAGGNMYLDPNPTGDSGDLIVLGNLIVNGETTTISSTEVTITDLQLRLADSATNATEANGAGLIIGDSATFTGTTRPEISYDGINDTWDLNKKINSVFTTLDSAFSVGDTPFTDVLANTFFLAGQSIDLTYNGTADTLTIAAQFAEAGADSAGAAIHAGVAFFDSDQMTVSATTGFVTIYDIDGGIYP